MRTFTRLGIATALAVTICGPTWAAEQPVQEIQFVAAVQQAKEAYNAGHNDMQKGATRPKRAKEICSVLKSRAVKDWIGKVYSLSSNGDGNGVLELVLSDDIYIKTWNNSFSDSGDHTLINPDSSVGKAAADLEKGQTVKFSGTFFSSQTDCVKEGSMSLSGSMTEPEFIFRFSAVAPAK